MGVKVTRHLGHFLDQGFHKVFSYRLKLREDCSREFNRVNGDWSVRVKAASDSSNNSSNTNDDDDDNNITTMMLMIIK